MSKPGSSTEADSSGFGPAWIEGALPGPLRFGAVEFHELDAPRLVGGTELSGFELVRCIGRGGMGEVWEARQLSLGGRRVALKFVRPDRVTPRQLEYFAREARAGGRLAHPGLVGVYASGEAEGLAWIAMELVEGGRTLRGFLDESARSVELNSDHDRRVALSVAEIADAMQAAHGAGVIHRDLKPQNVLVTSTGHPRVTDFGLARIADESALSQTGELAGTYAYMSPEQVSAKRGAIDARSDVFSLGVILYELLTLQRPFRGDTSHQVATQILFADPPDPRTVRSRIPRDLAVIACKTLEKDRTRRYASMAELAADLRRFLAGEPIRARAVGRLERAWRWIRRNPVPSGIGGSVVLALAATLGALWVARRSEDRARSADARSEAQRHVVERERYVSTIRSVATALESGSVKDARDLLGTCPSRLRGWEWHLLDHAVDSARTVLRAPDPPARLAFSGSEPTRVLGAVRSPEGSARVLDLIHGDEVAAITSRSRSTFESIDPLGTTLLCVDEEHELLALALRKGAGPQVVTSLDEVPTSEGWAADGSICALVFKTKPVVLVDVARSKTIALPLVLRRWARRIALDGDGSDLALGTQHDLLTFERRSDGEWRRGRWFPHLTRDLRAVAVSPDGTRYVAADSDGRVHLCSSVQGIGPETLSIDAKQPSVLAFSLDGDSLAVGTEEGTIWIEELSKRERRSLAGHRSRIVDVAFAEDDRHVVSCSVDGEVRRWTREEPLGGRRIILPIAARGTMLRFAPDASLLVASADEDGDLVLSSIPAIEQRGTVHGVLDNGGGACFAVDGAEIYVPTADGGCGVIRCRDGSFQGRLGEPGEDVLVTAASSRAVIATATAGGGLSLWSREGRLLSHESPVAPPVVAMCFSPDGELLALCRRSGPVVVLFAADLSPAHELIEDTLIGSSGEPVSNALLAWSGERLVLSRSSLRTRSGVDGQFEVQIRSRLELWDTSTFRLLQLMAAGGRKSDSFEEEAVLQASFDRSGERLLTSSSNGKVRLWDADTGQDLITLNVFDGLLHKARVTVEDLDGEANAYFEGGPVACWGADQRSILVVQDDRLTIWEPRSDR